nr:hypothetical protein [Escherichia coli]
MGLFKLGRVRDYYGLRRNAFFILTSRNKHAHNMWKYQGKQAD